MQRHEVIERLAQHEQELREMGVKSLALFGSAARSQAATGSDVDLLVELERPAGLFRLLEVRYRIEEILGCEVDLVTRAGVHPALRDRIFGEAVDVIPAA